MYTVFALALISGFAMAARFDPPDLNFEFKLHQRYVDSKSLDAQQNVGWFESYRLQSGESLWDISQMLYGDGAYWPKVWAQNQTISNPHLIRKGHTLQFLMGSEDEVPSFRISEDGDPGVELAAAQSESQVEVPPPEFPARPVLRVPPSFPEWQQVYRKRPDNFQIDDSRMKLEIKAVANKIPLTGFAQDDELKAVGNFLESEKESGLPVVGQYVYVKMKKGIGHVGEKYLIVRDHGEIQRLSDQVENGITSHFIQIYGDIELSDTVTENIRKKNVLDGFDMYRALILHALDLSEANYDLIPGKHEDVSLTPSGTSSGASAQLIGSTKINSSAIYGLADIVFLNKGTNQGLAPGQILSVFINRSIRDTGTALTFGAAPSGKVKIIRVDKGCSTGVIISAVDSIQQGDRVQPEMDAAGEANKVEESQPLDSESGDASS